MRHRTNVHDGRFSISPITYMLVIFVQIIVSANFSTRKNRTSSLPLETWDGWVGGCVLLAVSPCRKIFHYFNNIYFSRFCQNKCQLFTSKKNRTSLPLETWDGSVGWCVLLTQTPCWKILHYFNHILSSNSCQNNCKRELLFYRKSDHPPYYPRHGMAQSWDVILTESSCRKIFHFFNHIYGCYFCQRNSK
jgi:hypothetical protein